MRRGSRGHRVDCLRVEFPEYRLWSLDEDMAGDRDRVVPVKAPQIQRRKMEPACPGVGSELAEESWFGSSRDLCISGSVVCSHLHSRILGSRFTYLLDVPGHSSPGDPAAAALDHNHRHSPDREEQVAWHIADSYAAVDETWMTPEEPRSHVAP